MPFLSFSTHLREPRPKRTQNDSGVQLKQSKDVSGKFDLVREKLNIARKKYDNLMPQTNSKSVGHPVVHGCPTLDEAFYHFSTDEDSRDEQDCRNRSQVVSKQLKALEESKEKEKRGSNCKGVLSEQSKAANSEDEQPYLQTILRVSQIWIWTIGDSTQQNALGILLFTNKCVQDG